MLGKLIKHDFRALSRMLFPLAICVLAGGLLATLLTTLVLRLSEGLQNMLDSASTVSTLVMVLFVFTIGIIIFAIFSSLLVSVLLICAHFFRSFLTDEGYLTFTLPVTTGRLLWSKLITGLIWELITGTLIIVTCLLFAVFGTAQSGIGNQVVLSFLRETWLTYLPMANESFSVPLAVAEMLLLVILASAAHLMELYFAIIVGGQVAKKHRVLAAIGMYLLINFGVGILESVYQSLMLDSNLMWGALNEIGLYIHSMFLWNSLLSVGLAAGFFLLSRSILKRNLNLP